MAGRAPGAVEPVTAARLESLALDWPGPVTLADLVTAAAAAEAVWGCAGVALRADGAVEGLALIAPGTHLPAHHPLSQHGLDRGVPGLLALWAAAGSPDTATAKWLIQGLCGRLVTRAPALDAHGALRPGATPYAPPAALLAAVGFQPLGQPAQRYRLTLTRTARWSPVEWARRVKPSLAWAPNPAPATRST